jgi:hypothetical protein
MFFIRTCPHDRRTNISLGELVEQRKLMAKRETVPVYIVLPRRFSTQTERAIVPQASRKIFVAENVSNLRIN